MSFADFETGIARFNDVLCTLNVLAWDSRTMMPAGGIEGRSHQIATLTGIARDMATGEAMARAIESARTELEGVGPDDLRLRAVETAAAGIAQLSRLPADLVRESAELKTRAQAAWVEARAADDFAAFAPWLERTVAMQRTIAEALGYDSHPYDPLVAMYEPDMSWERLRTLFSGLRKELAPLLEAARNDPPARTDVLERRFPIDRQKAFSREIAARFGYDFERGRLDDTAHPFEISFTRGDVRITGRFRETWLPGGLFAVWHEVGHGTYEQGIDPAFTRSAFACDFLNLYAVGGASFGTHESQSRLWENRVARSHRFWELNYDALRSTFSDELADVSLDDFWRAVNAPRPNLIRVEADELTYDFHIMLRAEIEAGLMAGEIAVADLPAIWAERMRTDLGVEVPNDADGVLQDVHWSSGMIGSFPTYTIGNIMSAQFFRAAAANANVADGLETGDYAPLRAWLRENVHRHGRSRSPNALLEAATGQSLSTEAYIGELEDKVARLTA
ncbi:carboxypeptidase M32 [Pararhizobium mangrovi]|uniref:Metal-dependent carboxypeptidase n=1 Tax=Pararhizobium mangrovi TaxID=2590452 RepID=A0A506U5L3_9HYPH|nr:carboxypeptidase M32 [Pararhizobium mangrovi]TPW29662.1 carboxypeptidase M32 [Pararhizobium mangrovi]